MSPSLFYSKFNNLNFSKLNNPYFFFRNFRFSAHCSLDTLDFSSSDEQNQFPIQTQDYFQRRMQFFAISGKYQEAWGILKSMACLSVKGYNSLFYYYLKSKHADIEKVCELFSKMKVYGVHPNSFTFNIVINGLVSQGRVQYAYYFVEKMVRNEFVPSCDVLFNLLKKSLRCRDLVLSINVLEMMLKWNYVPKRLTSNLLIFSLCDAGNLRESYFVLCALISKGFSPCCFSYNPILWALCKSGQSYIALALFSSLKKKGFQCNVRSYTALVHGFSCQGLWEEAFIVLREMRKDDCVPNVITYTTLIKYLCDYGEIGKASRVWDTMEKDGCCVDTIPQNIILSALLQRGNVSEACEVMQVFNEKGSSPDPYTYTALVGGLLKSGRVSIAEELMLHILTNCSFVDIVTCNIYFNILCSTERSVEAFSLLTSWIKKGFIPSNATYNTILKGFCLEKDLDTALKLFDWFEWPEGHPDLISFNTVLSAAGKSMDSLMIRRVLDRMESENVKLNAVGSTIMLQYFCKAGNLPEAFKHLDNMIRNGPNPTTMGFNVLLDGLCKKGMFENAYRIFTKRTFCPDTTSYNILIHASLREGNYLLAEKLKSDMLLINLKPDVVTYRTFIHGLCKEGKITDSVQLLHKMMETGINPGAFTYNIILYAMFQRGRLEDAIVLLESMARNGCECDAYTLDILSKSKLRGYRVIGKAKE